jgi:tetratricopeptide (TPR) repeat protein
MPAPSPQASAGPTNQEFRKSMSDGLAALERRDFATARDHLRRAVELDPASPESADALLAAEEGLRLQEIASHQATASQHEAAERWRDALGDYEAVLALDPTIKFAQEGAERSRARADLSDRLDFHLQNPERLSTDEVLRDAETQLEEASQIRPAGERLSRQIEGLRQIVAVASTPIRVALVSDNLTEVTVYKVGRLGAFERRVLELRPGTYTVVGRREGYRDVRRELRVAPGQEIEPLTIRCEEKI